MGREKAFIPIGRSLLFLEEASLSSRTSLMPALFKRMEFLDFACKELMSPLRFLEICLRVFSKEFGILDV